MFKTWLVVIIVALVACNFDTLLKGAFAKLFTPICSVPGVSYFELEICGYNSMDNSKVQNSDRRHGQTSSPSGLPQPSAEYAAVLNSQAYYGKIIASSPNIVALPLNIKFAQTSMRDLQISIETSGLPHSDKTTLTQVLGSFIPKAQQTSEEMQTFYSKLNMLVNMVITTTQWTERVLDEIKSKHDQGRPPSASQVSVWSSSKATMEAAVAHQFNKHATILIRETDKLIIIAESLNITLFGLDGRAADIFTTLSYLKKIHRDSKNEFNNRWFFQKWFKGHQLTEILNHLEALEDAVKIRKIASDHITTVIVDLGRIKNDMETMREQLKTTKEHSAVGMSLDLLILQVKASGQALLEKRDVARDAADRKIRKITETGKLL